jgi:uncharacterized membrane protein
MLLIWCSGIFIEWLINLNGHLVILLPFLQKTYSIVCHQEKLKLISTGVSETLTCARCTGIYIGLFFVSIVFLFFVPKIELRIKYLFAAALPMFIDVALTTLKIHQYTKSAAFITGFLLGSTGFLYLCDGLKNLISELKNRT